MLEENLKPAMKPQYVDSIPKKVKGKVGEFIEKKDTLKLADKLKHDL